MLELVRRAGLVLLVAGVFLQGLLGLLPAEKVHTAPRSPARGRKPQPWWLEARRAGRVAGRLYAVRLQVVVVTL